MYRFKLKSSWFFDWNWSFNGQWFHPIQVVDLMVLLNDGAGQVCRLKVVSQIQIICAILMNRKQWSTDINCNAENVCQWFFLQCRMIHLKTSNCQQVTQRLQWQRCRRRQDEAAWVSWISRYYRYQIMKGKNTIHHLSLYIMINTFLKEKNM